MVNGAVKIKYWFIMTFLGNLRVLEQDFPASEGATRLFNDKTAILKTRCSEAVQGSHKVIPV